MLDAEKVADEAIRELESDMSVSSEDFYCAIMVVMSRLKERMECAAGDGVNLATLQMEE